MFDSDRSANLKAAVTSTTRYIADPTLGEESHDPTRKVTTAVLSESE